MLICEADEAIQKALDNEEKAQLLLEICIWVNMGPICMKGIYCHHYSTCSSWLIDRGWLGLYYGRQLNWEKGSAEYTE